ncbi:MAG: hypothetical protein IT291_00750 [Deltaproteobacteria bacterium]|nr:hypothetical protein [Deltaproteobacteria bacterium]
MSLKYSYYCSLPFVFLLLGLPSFALAHPEIEARIEVLTKKIEADPNNGTLYLRRGDLHREHRAWEKALKDFAKVRDIEPNLPDVDLYNGQMWLDAGEPEKASALLDRYIANRPDDAEGFIKRARALKQLNHLAVAIADLGTAISLIEYPSPDLYLERAALLGQSGPENRGELRSGLEEGIKRLGPLVVLVDELIRLEIEDKNYEKALALLDTLPEKVQALPNWLTRRGDILHQSGKLLESKNFYQYALEKINNLPEHRKNIPAIKRNKQKLVERLSAISENSKAPMNDLTQNATSPIISAQNGDKNRDDAHLTAIFFITAIAILFIWLFYRFGAKLLQKRP